MQTRRPKARDQRVVEPVELSPTVASAYRRLVRRPVPISDPELSPVFETLVTSGLANIVDLPDEGGRLLVAVEPATVLAVVGQAEQSYILDRQRRLLAWQEALQRLQRVYESMQAVENVATGLRFLTGRPEIATAAIDLMQSARRELNIALATRELLPWPQKYVQAPVRAIQATGTPRQQRGMVTTRVHTQLPLTFLTVDDCAGLVTGQVDQVPTAVLIREPTVVMALSVLFDRLWRESRYARMTRPAEAGPVTPLQLRVVMHLARGARDEEVAEALGVSVRTVRRHIADLMASLGVTTRFAAAVEAGRRGWITGGD